MMVLIILTYKNNSFLKQHYFIKDHRIHIAGQ